MFAKKKWQISRVKSSERFLRAEIEAGCDLVCLRLGEHWRENLSPTFFRDNLRPFLERGGVVILGGYGDSALNDLLTDAAPGLKWAGWEIDPARRATMVAPGTWLQQPNRLGEFFHGGLAPSSGFYVTGLGWTVLAEQKMKNGAPVAFLARRQVGQGCLLVITSDLGCGGGSEMFGNLNSEAAAALIENLFLAFKPAAVAK